MPQKINKINQCRIKHVKLINHVVSSDYRFSDSENKLLNIFKIPFHGLEPRLILSQTYGIWIILDKGGCDKMRKTMKDQLHNISLDS